MIVGITYFARKDEANGGGSIWSNGANQNIFFLYHLLKQSPVIKAVYLINGGDGDSISAAMQQAQDITLCDFNGVADTLDVLIEAGAQIAPEQAQRIHARKGVVIGYRCGNDYVMDVERLCFGRPSGAIFNGTAFDVIWTHAQHMNTCKDFWEIGLRTPVEQVPHIWSPYFVDRAAQEITALPGSVVFGYEATLNKRSAQHSMLPTSRFTPTANTLLKRVGNFEPNVNVVKSSVTPLLSCEAAFRQRPELWGEMYFCNTEHLKPHVTFNNLVSRMDIVTHKRASFEARYPLPTFLAKFVDIVLCHQWENGLNYVYYDALYGHYPLVHNSPFIQDVGYYYEGFDAQGAARALIQAATEHDAQLDEYAALCDAFIATRLISNPENIDAHVGRLVQLLAAKRR